MLTILFRENNEYEILDPIHSPIIKEYRTKCEFTIGKDLNGERTVGFLLGQYRDGITSVLDPNECLHVSEKAKEIAKKMKVIDDKFYVSYSLYIRNT